MSHSQNVGKYGDPLTPRQIEVLRLICAGNATKEIAADLGLSSKTVDAHRTAIRTRLVPNATRYSSESLGMVAERMGLLVGVTVKGVTK